MLRRYSQLFSFVVLLLLAAAGLLLGSVHLAPADVLTALFDTAEADPSTAFIVWQSRLPQVCTALLSGAALAVSGLLMQTLFANPLADPGILGVNSGAALGVALVMLLMGGSAEAGGFVLSGYLLTILAALAGACAVTLLLLACSALLRGKLMLLITGVMVSYVVSSAISLLNFYATEQGVQSYIIWGMGNFGGVNLERLPAYALTIFAGLTGTMLLCKPLNALLLGDNYAGNLGVRVRRMRFGVLLLASWLTAAVTALCGPIAFVGLAVPHAARLMISTSDHRRLLPLTALWGANTALLCLLITYLPGERGVLPINALTPVIGVPVVMYILLKGRKGA